MIDAGYFAKRVLARPEWLEAPAVREICSVSECMSPGAPNWIERWLHNELGWFNRREDALAVIPPGCEREYRLFAYRLHPEVFSGLDRIPLVLPRDVRAEPIPDTFRSLGFDCANRSMPDVLGMECSPLSCNAMAAEFAINEFCLFSAFDQAVAGAIRFSVEQPEPGDYYVIEVLEGERDDLPRVARLDEVRRR
jgi:hypothetical protein